MNHDLSDKTARTLRVLSAVSALGLSLGVTIETAPASAEPAGAQSNQLKLDSTQIKGESNQQKFDSSQQKVRSNQLKLKPGAAHELNPQPLPPG